MFVHMMITDVDEEVGFERPLRAASLMAAFPAAWCVAGGWALDLFLGRVSRGHAHVEVAVFRDAQRALHDYLYLSQWSFYARVTPGQAVRWDRTEWLEPPVHEVYAESEDGRERLELLLNERRGRQWQYRRCAGVSLPIERAFRRGMLNVPILAPEVVLLCKSQSPRPKDHLDFRAVVERLDEESLRWLRAAIERAHPESPFLSDPHFPEVTEIP